MNQPLSIQPWGRDGYKRRYWLIEGQDDTHFRVYRESNPTLKNNTWWSIAGSIEEVQVVASRLDEDPTQHARTLRERMRAAIPRFEAGEEVFAVRRRSAISAKTAHRNERDATIAWREKLNLHARSQDFPFTRVVLEARG